MILSFSQTIFAQYLVDSLIAKNKIKSAICSIYKSSDTIPTSVNFLTFDQYGKVISLVDQNKKNGKVCHKVFYTRTESGKYRSETHSFSCFSETNLDSTVTKHDEYGDLDDPETPKPKILTIKDSLNRIKERTKTYSNHTDIDTFSYDMQGRLTETNHKSNGKIVSTNNYLYNSKCQLICIIYSEFVNTNKIGRQEKTILTYTKSGLLDKQVCQTVIGKSEFSGDITYKLTYR